ncbi:MAG: RibD family protein, partial [Planctomycetota bacterium]
MSYAITQAQQQHLVNSSPRRGLLLSSGDKILAYGEQIETFSCLFPIHFYTTLEIEPDHSLFQQLSRLPIQHVFTALPYPDLGVHSHYKQYFESRGIPLSYGIGKESAFLLNKKFFTSTLKQRPYLLAKWAMTADGKIATRTGKSRWISGEQSRFYAHQLRAEYQAILVGIGTILADDPLLTCRTEGKNPIRLLLDRQLRTPVTSQICQTAKEVSTHLFCLNTVNSSQMAILERTGIQIHPLEAVSFSAVCEQAFSLGIQSILIEGGGTILESAFQEQLLDEIHLSL